jgi:hypothetical protein
MLKLTYTRQSDRFQTVTVIGDPIGIQDLYWQLTHNYKAQDGTKIGTITVSNLEGLDLPDGWWLEPYRYMTRLNNLQ